MNYKPEIALGVALVGLIVAAVAASPNVERTATVAEGDVDGPSVDAPNYVLTGKPCPQTNGGWMMGDNKVECDFACAKGDVLAIKVTSGDDVYVFGSGDCGGARAHCEGKKTCSGTSRGSTTSAGTGKCVAESDEIWNSPLTADCTSAPLCTNPITCREDANTGRDAAKDA